MMLLGWALGKRHPATILPRRPHVAVCRSKLKVKSGLPFKCRGRSRLPAGGVAQALPPASRSTPVGETLIEVRKGAISKGGLTFGEVFLDVGYHFWYSSACKKLYSKRGRPFAAFFVSSAANSDQLLRFPLLTLSLLLVGRIVLC
jgi:hypothetical protein